MGNKLPIFVSECTKIKATFYVPTLRGGVILYLDLEFRRWENQHLKEAGMELYDIHIVQGVCNEQVPIKVDEIEK